MKTIALTQSKFALVDDDVYEWAVKHKWHTQRIRDDLFYAVRSIRRGIYITRIYLHREIMGAAKGTMVDHINGDGLNCTRSNMRLASKSENQRNCRKPSNNTSGHKGVYWHKGVGKWRAHIRVDGKRICIGDFANLEDAALAYDAAARKHHGEFARLNFS